jgi:hypothetical protein
MACAVDSGRSFGAATLHFRSVCNVLGLALPPDIMSLDA